MLPFPKWLRGSQSVSGVTAIWDSAQMDSLIGQDRAGDLRERDRNHVTVESRGKRDNMLGERQNKKILKDRLRKREWNRPEPWEAERKTERLHENWGGLFRTWGEGLFKLSMTLSHKERFFNEFGSKLSRWSEVETKSRAYNQVQHHNRQSNPWV